MIVHKFIIKVIFNLIGFLNIIRYIFEAFDKDL